MKCAQHAAKSRSHIFIPSKATDTPEQQKTAEQRINGVVAELSVPNADFGEIAKRISEDRSDCQRR